MSKATEVQRTQEQAASTPKKIVIKAKSNRPILMAAHL